MLIGHLMQVTIRAHQVAKLMLAAAEEIEQLHAKIGELERARAGQGLS